MLGTRKHMEASIATCLITILQIVLCKLYRSASLVSLRQAVFN